MNTFLKNPYVQITLGGLVLMAIDYLVLTHAFPLSTARIVPFYALHVLGIGFGFLMIGVLQVLSRINSLILGNTYIAMTFIEMVIGFLIGQPLREQIEGMNPEKALFLILFLVYLTVQTMASIRLINKV